MALQVILADRDVTAQATALTFSNVDPGGYEACSFTLPGSAAQPAPGDAIRIMEGLSVAWEGMVEDPGPTQNHASAQGVVQGVGYGVRLKDDPYQMVYVDRDLSRWGGLSRGRELILLTGGYRIDGTIVQPDATSGLPALAMKFQGDWAAPALPISAGLYDAGAGCSVRTFYYDRDTQNVTLADANWGLGITGAGVDDMTSAENIDIRTFAATGYEDFVTAHRYLESRLFFAATPDGSVDVSYALFVRNLTVYGDHGLTRHGSDPGGFYTEDIARHALAQATGLAAGVIDATGVIAEHAVYRDPTLPETVIADMATLAAVHWGVWEAASILDQTPRLDFRARPTVPTAVVSRSDCDGLTITVRRSQLYDTCTVTYTDAAGTPGEVTVSASNPRMPAGTTRTLGPLSIGTSSAGAAADYAADALALAQASQRGGGSPTVPADVLLPGGGSKPASLLKAGLDRLKITDLPDAGSWTETDTRRYDTFRVKRVETTVEAGVSKTRVELDEGADLLEVLNARLAVDAVLTGG